MLKTPHFSTIRVTQKQLIYHFLNFTLSFRLIF